MNKQFLAAGAMVCSLVLGSQPTLAAKGFDYTYGEAAFRYSDSDVETGQGFLVGFSYGATDMIHIDGRYSRMWINDWVGTSDADLNKDEFKLGIGGHFSVSDNVDLLATLRYVDEQLTGSVIRNGETFRRNINDDAEGYELEVAGRIMFGKELEITPHASYLDVGPGDDSGFGLGLVYKLDRNFSLLGDISYYSDDSETGIFAGLRLNM